MFTRFGFGEQAESGFRKKAALQSEEKATKAPESCQQRQQLTEIRQSRRLIRPSPLVQHFALYNDLIYRWDSP